MVVWKVLSFPLLKLVIGILREFLQEVGVLTFKSLYWFLSFLSHRGPSAIIRGADCSAVKARWEAGIKAPFYDKPSKGRAEDPQSYHQAQHSPVQAGLQQVSIFRYHFLSPSFYPSIYLSVYLSIHQSIYLYIYLSIYLSIFISIYLSIYLSLYLSIYLSIYLYIYLSIYLSIYLYIYLSIYLSIFISIYLSIYLYIYLSIYLSFYLSLYLSIYLSVFLSIFISIYLSVCLSIYLYILSIYLSVFSIYLYIYLSVYLSIYLSRLSVFLSIFISIYLSICLSIYIYLSIYLYIYLSIYLSFYLSIYLSDSFESVGVIMKWTHKTQILSSICALPSIVMQFWTPYLTFQIRKPSSLSVPHQRLVLRSTSSAPTRHRRDRSWMDVILSTQDVERKQAKGGRRNAKIAANPRPLPLRTLTCLWGELKDVSSVSV